MCKVVAELVYNDIEEYNHIVDMLGGEISRLKIIRNDHSGDEPTGLQTGIVEDEIFNPDIVRTKGCGAMPTGTPNSQRRRRTCGVCGIPGHNKRNCPNANTNPASGNTQSPATEARQYYDQTYGLLSQSVSES
jgi:hypothetical protein